MALDKRHHASVRIVIDGTAYEKTLAQEDAEFRRLMREYSRKRITMAEIRQRDAGNRPRSNRAVRVTAEAEK